jgi:hypothetical protein
VRSMPNTEIRRRQKECRMLHEMVFGRDSKQHFTVAMKIWAIRINNALQKHSQIQEAVFT